MARARPSALLAGADRRDGAVDAVVAQEYQALRTRVWALAEPDEASLSRLQQLEESDTGATWTPWQTTLRRLGADEDEGVIEASQDVWDALGPNAHTLQFRDRPKTGKGFIEARLWLTTYVLGAVALCFAAAVVDGRYGVPWWLAVPVMLGAWTLLLVLLFRSTYSRRARVGKAELPYL